MLVNGSSKVANLIGRKEGRRSAAKMHLNHFSVWIEHRAHLRELAVKVVQVSGGFGVFGRDDSCAAAIPAKGFAKWDVKIDREVPRDFVVRQQFIGKFVPADLVAEA